jgi:hypothetical protein
MVYVSVTVAPAVIVPGVAVKLWLNTGVTPFVTGALPTVTVVDAEVAAKLPDAAVVAVRLFVPTGSALVVRVATQLPPVRVNVPVPRVVLPLVNVADVGQAPAIGVSVSVSVTGVPYVSGEGAFEVRAGEVTVTVVVGAAEA